MKISKNHIKEDNMTLFKWGVLHSVGIYARCEEFKFIGDPYFKRGIAFGASIQERINFVN